MNVKLEGAEVEVNVVRLNSESLEENLRSTAAVLCEILHNECANTADNDSLSPAKEGYPCQYCGKLYKSASTLTIHYRLKHPDDVLEARCELCDKSYASLLSLQKHIRYMHQFEHRCQVCYRTFSSVKTLQHHGEVCVKTETPCPICRKMYNSKLSLRNHIKYKHPQERNHACGVCRRTFTSSRMLSNHIATIHSESADLKCRQCDKSFKCMSTLRCHYLSKHSQSSARCNLCRKVLASRGNLSRHLIKTHDIAAAYSQDRFWCGICNADFQSANELIIHVMAICSAP